MKAYATLIATLFLILFWIATVSDQTTYDRLVTSTNTLVGVTSTGLLDKASSETICGTAIFRSQVLPS
jgi:hypothetical protein